MKKEKTQSIFDQIYVVDLVKHLIQSKHYLAFIYIILCYFIILFTVIIFYPSWALSFNSPLWIAVIYVLLFAIYVSPVGERVIRMLNGAKRLEKKEHINRLEPLFIEVKNNCLSKYPELISTEGITLYIKEDKEPNAEAIGRSTIIATTGLLRYSDEEIKAILAHEFGHISMHDTDLRVLSSIGGNIILIISALFDLFLTVVAALSQLLVIIPGFGFVFMLLIQATVFIGKGIFTVLSVIWVLISELLLMKSSKDSEYMADAFACDIGYTDGLIRALNTSMKMENLDFDDEDEDFDFDIEDDEENEEDFNFNKFNKDKFKVDTAPSFSFSHPNAQQRIDKIEQRIG